MQLLVIFAPSPVRSLKRETCAPCTMHRSNDFSEEETADGEEEEEPEERSAEGSQPARQQAGGKQAGRQAGQAAVQILNKKWYKRSSAE